MACASAPPAVPYVVPVPPPLPCTSVPAAIEPADDEDELAFLEHAELTNVKIARVEISGLAAVPEQMARSRLRSARGTPFDREIAADDVRRLWSLETFSRVRLEAREGRRGVLLRFVVSERPMVGRVHVAGEVDEMIAWQRLRHLGGTIYNPIQLSRAVGELRAEHQRAGYRGAVIKVGVEDRSRSGGRVDICVAVVTGRRYAIASIDFVGNKAISDSRLRDELSTRDGRVNRAGRLLDDSLLEADHNKLASLYHDRGMINATVGEPRIHLDRESSTVRVEFAISEGKTYRLGEVTLVGDIESLPPGPKLLRSLGLRRGELFSRAAVGEAIVSIRTQLGARGLSNALVTPLTEVDSERGIIDLKLEVERQ